MKRISNCNVTKTYVSQEKCPTIIVAKPSHNAPENIDSSKLFPEIDKRALKADEAGNCGLSLAIEECKFHTIRELYKTQKKLSDADLLRKIAFDMTNSDVQAKYGLSKNVTSHIYSEARDQLIYMGEDVDSVIDACNIFS